VTEQAQTAALAALVAHRRDEMIDELEMLVEHESPTGDVARLDALAAVIERDWVRIGAVATRHDRAGTGTHLELVWPGPPGTRHDAAPALLVGHHDTVHDIGTLQRNPWRIDEQGRAWGPGTQDMKSGLVIARHALAALAEHGRPLARPVRMLITADEEIGSPTSQQLIRARARECAYALVFEAATSDGAFKTQRKGVALWTVAVRGRAAHAGQNFFDGVNANVALAGLVTRLAALSDPAAGTTVNVGVMRGGTRANVVAARADAAIDVRFTSDHEARRISEALAGLHSDLDVEIQVDGGINRPAMPRTAETARLFARAQACAKAAGFELAEAAAGGASDGNFTAAEGAPTLDGFGGVGAGLHTDEEYVLVDSLPQRAALLAAFLATEATS
jgi:glutamate carboxypeptidase